MKELSIEKMEMVSGGICHSNTLGFFAGAVVGATVVGGPIGFVVGLVGSFGGLILNYIGDPNC